MCVSTTVTLAYVKVVSLINSAVNMALPTFASEHRAGVPAAVDRHLLAAHSHSAWQ